MKFELSLVRVGGVFVVAALCGLASAEPEFVELVKAKYKGGTCLTCHSDPPSMNPYGKAVQTEMEAANAESPTPEIFSKLDGKDSDGDGISNAAELSKGESPGVPNASVVLASNVRAKPLPKTEPLVPKHAFHPLLAHFPIALFLFGVLLEAIGAVRKDLALRKFAFWNLGFGAASALGTVATGFASFVLRNFAFEGTAMLHLLVCTCACLFMLAAAYMKAAKPDAGGKYWLILALATTCTMIGGHLGATLVYG